MTVYTNLQSNTDYGTITASTNSSDAYKATTGEGWAANVGTTQSSFTWTWTFPEEITFSLDFTSITSNNWIGNTHITITTSQSGVIYETTESTVVTDNRNDQFTGTSITVTWNGQWVHGTIGLAGLQLTVPDPTYTFQINANPLDSTVTIDGVERTTLTDIQSGANITWSVEKTGYVTQSGTNTITQDTTLSITLVEVEPEPPEPDDPDDPPEPDNPPEPPEPVNPDMPYFEITTQWYDEQGHIFKDKLIEVFNSIEEKINELASYDVGDIGTIDISTVIYPDITAEDVDNDSNKIVNLKSYIDLIDLVNFPLEVKTDGGNGITRVVYINENYQKITINKTTTPVKATTTNPYVHLDIDNNEIVALSSFNNSMPLLAVLKNNTLITNDVKIPGNVDFNKILADQYAGTQESNSWGGDKDILIDYQGQRVAAFSRATGSKNDRQIALHTLFGLTGQTREETYEQQDEEGDNE